MIGVEPEIIQRAVSNGIGVGILQHGFAVPGDRITGQSHSPRHAAVPLVVKGAVVSPAGFLRRRVEADVANINSWAKRHTEGLNAAVEVLVIQSILIVPDPGSWISHSIAHKPEAIVRRIRLDLLHCSACVCPSHYGRFHSHSGTDWRK